MRRAAVSGLLFAGALLLVGAVRLFFREPAHARSRFALFGALVSIVPGVAALVKAIILDRSGRSGPPQPGIRWEDRAVILTVGSVIRPFSSRSTSRRRFAPEYPIRSASSF